MARSPLATLTRVVGYEERVTSWLAALVALRVFYGIVYLVNGLAKLTGTGEVGIGPFRSFLIDRGIMRSILAHDAATTVGPVHDLARSVLLPHFSAFALVVAALEIAAGAGLITGVLGRVSAALAFLLALAVQVVAIGAGDWSFEYLVEVVPLAILATVWTPAVDRLLPARRRIPVTTGRRR